MSRHSTHPRSTAILFFPALCTLLAAACRATPTPSATVSPTAEATPGPGVAHGELIYLAGGDLWRMTDEAPPERLTEDGWVSRPVLSPDGQYAAYLTVPEDERPTEPSSGQLPHELWLLDLAEEAGERVSAVGAEPSVPDWDPQSRSLIWGEDDRIMQLVPGGEPEVLVAGLTPLLFSVHPDASERGQGILWDECGDSSCRLRMRRPDGEIVTVAESVDLAPFHYVWVEQPGGEAVAWITLEMGPDIGTWSIHDLTSGATAELNASLALLGPADRAITFAPDGRLRIVDVNDPEGNGYLVSPPPRPFPSGFSDVTWTAAGSIVFRVAEPAEIAGLYAARPPAAGAVRILPEPEEPPLTETPDGWPRAPGVPRRLVLIPVAQ